MRKSSAGSGRTVPSNLAAEDNEIIHPFVICIQQGLILIGRLLEEISSFSNYLRVVCERFPSPYIKL
jgi:hypothetical protein